MEKNVSKNGYKLIKGNDSSSQFNVDKIVSQKSTRYPNHLAYQVNGLIKGRPQLTSRRRVIPSFYAFLTIFVVTLLVILVNKIPTGPHLYPDVHYQARLKADYFKSPSVNLSQFVLETELLIKPKLNDLDDIRLVVIVSSSVQHFDQRQAIRDSWSKLVNFHQQKLFFIIGKSVPPPRGNLENVTDKNVNSSSSIKSTESNGIKIISIDSKSKVHHHDRHDDDSNCDDEKLTKLNEQIVHEGLSFNDLIQYDFYDSYYNLTLKSLLMLRFFNQEILNLTKKPLPFSSYYSSSSSSLSSIYSSSSPSPSPIQSTVHRQHGRLKPPPMVPNEVDLKIRKPIFLFKVDDDMFVQVNNLINLIDKLMVAFKVRKLPWNHQQDGYKILLGGLIKKAQLVRDPRSKYFVPFNVYPYNTYPNYLSGTGYLMSADVARSLFITATFANKCKYFFLEDLFITGFCSAKAVKMYDDYRYFEGER